MQPEYPSIRAQGDRHNATNTGVELESAEKELSASDFRALVGLEYGIDGASPEHRVEQLKQLTVDRRADMLDTINRRLQGSEESLVHDR